MIKPSAILIDLPVFPKGSVTLSLPMVAALLADSYEVGIYDLNITDTGDFFNEIDKIKEIAFCGLKVSSQNVEQAKKLSLRIKKKYPSVPLVWGGELPTLLPDECLKYADSIVQGLWEPIAESFTADLGARQLQKKYIGDNKFPLSDLKPPRFDLIKNVSKYYSFMGWPMETSRGCTEVCTFCMVHVMQKKNYFTKSKEQIREELRAYKGKFINIVDYNLGVSDEHVIDMCELIAQSGATGWMGEMCIEQLDNDKTLQAMQGSGCRMIYCGLETIDEQALNSVHKMNTNHIGNYERIIRKVQSYGIQIASGFILGIDGMNERTFEKTFEFFQRMGIIYAKLTFLTYNPGTKVATYMQKKGTFMTDDISYYDGNHLSFLSNGVEERTVMKGTEMFIKQFYSTRNIIARSYQTRLSMVRRWEFILFNICYRETYLQWIDHDVLNRPEQFKTLLNGRLNKRWPIRLADRALAVIRRF